MSEQTMPTSDTFYIFICNLCHEIVIPASSLLGYGPTDMMFHSLPSLGVEMTALYLSCFLDVFFFFASHHVNFYI
jgi:hypothetical protein